MTIPTLIGNVLAVVVLAGAVAAQVLSPLSGPVFLASVAYLAWGVLWIGDRASSPSRTLPMCQLLTAAEVVAYRSYHTHLAAPVAALMFSNFLNGLRLIGFLWAAFSFWQGSLLVGLSLVAYFFVAGGLIVRFAPRYYFSGPAANGNPAAVEHLRLLDAVDRARRRHYEQA